MAIQFKCDSCGKTLKADDSKAGKRVKCPGCTAVITIPQLEIEEEEELFENPQYEDEDDDDEDFARPARRKSKSGSRRRRQSFEVADPGKRFLGWFLDNLLNSLMVVPGFVMAVIGIGEAEARQDPEVPVLALIGFALCAIGVLAAFGLNVYFYATRSQSLAKWMLGLQVIDYETDEPAGIAKAFFLRGFLNQFLCGIPALGGLYFLVDSLMIFGEEHRCLHDQIAGTYVADIS